MTETIARAIQAIEQHDVAYETTPTDTVIEANTLEEMFAAIEAAHEAIDGTRVVTSIEIDHQPGREQHLRDRVSAVEQALGRPPRREQPVGQRGEATQRYVPAGRQGTQYGQAPRYGPPQQPGPQSRYYDRRYGTQWMQ